MTQLQRSKALARALARYDKAAAALEAARIAVDEVFFPWAAGRPTNRDEAREQLIATGFMEQATARDARARVGVR